MLSYGMSLVVWLRKSLSPSSQAGYKGYCRFGFLLPQGDDHPSPDEWLRRGRIDPRTVTAYYAGMLAMAYYCASYAGEDEYQVGSERDDLEKINSLLVRLSSEEQERSAIRDACWMEAQRFSRLLAGCSSVGNEVTEGWDTRWKRYSWHYLANHRLSRR